MTAVKIAKSSRAAEALRAATDNRTAYECPACLAVTFGDCVDECGRCGRRRGQA